MLNVYKIYIFFYNLFTFYIFYIIHLTFYIRTRIFLGSFFLLLFKDTKDFNQFCYSK